MQSLVYDDKLRNGAVRSQEVMDDRVASPDCIAMWMYRDVAPTMENLSMRQEQVVSFYLQSIVIEGTWPASLFLKNFRSRIVLHFVVKKKETDARDVSY